MKPERSTRIAIAIVATCLLQAHGNSASAGLAEIAKAFPHLSQTTISLVLTTMMVSIVPAMLLAGVLVKKVGEKRLVLIGFSMILVFGLSSFFIRDFALLIVARILTGVGTGLVTPLQAALIPQHFTGYKAQRLFGFQSATISMLGIGYGLIGGYLASLRWNNLFAVYLVALPALILIYFWLPRTRTVEAIQLDAMQKFHVSTKLFYLAGVMFTMSILMFQFPTGIAFLMEERDVGSSGTAGFCVAMFNTGSFVSSLLYGKIQRRLGTWSIPFGMMLSIVGLSTIGVSGWTGAPLPFYLFGSMIAGNGLGVIMPSMASRVTTLYRNSNVSLALAVVMGSFFTGSLLSPTVTRQAAVLPGGDNIAGRFVYAAAGLIVLLLIVVTTWKKGTGTHVDPFNQVES